MANIESRRVPASATLVAAILVLATACWAVAARLMNGMDMGVATERGSFGFFAAAWVTMMAAMMLPGAAPAIARHARMRGAVPAATLFAGTYLAIWALAGILAFALTRPHSSLVAGVVVIAAGCYELTPAKRHFRRRCLENTDSGLEFGLCCVGSTIGLMAGLVALGVMSLLWMAIIALIATAQKLLPENRLIDLPLALAIIGFGLVII
jgi:predicted metal-binding membrane protein